MAFPRISCAKWLGKRVLATRRPQGPGGVAGMPSPSGTLGALRDSSPTSGSRTMMEGRRRHCASGSWRLRDRDGDARAWHLADGAVALDRRHDRNAAVVVEHD